MKKTYEELSEEYICSELSLPRPVSAWESGGVILVAFDGPVHGLNGTNDSLGFLHGEASRIDLGRVWGT